MYPIMRRFIIITLLLLIATAFVTVVYFKNLNPPGTRTDKVMRTIPDDAPLIVEFNNEQGFYDIFNNNKALPAFIGQQKLDELDVLRRQILLNPSLEKFFTGQNAFISIHPLKSDVELLLTISAANGFDIQALAQLAKQKNSGLVVSPLNISGKPGYTIYINSIKKRFYIVNNQENIFSGSFSKELAEMSAAYKNQKEKQAFVLLSEQQNYNSLANLYVNYGKLSPLFDQLFQNKNTDIFRRFRLLPALAALSLNYKSDALMFNGTSFIQTNEPAGYLNLFTAQKPVLNQLKDLFPATTAYSTTFAVADPVKFETDLSQWHKAAKLIPERDQLFDKVKAETGVNLRSEFTRLLGTEFAVVTTRYLEKYAIISVKDGSKLKPLMMDISRAIDENVGEFNFEKLPFFLLGDPFALFRRPYYMILDNYLVLAETPGELASYRDTYLNRKFLNKIDQYREFDNLLAESCNVAFFIYFKNAQQILKRDLYPGQYNAFKNNEPGWSNFFAASCQLTAADKNFYTNFCMRLISDTTAIKKAEISH